MIFHTPIKRLTVGTLAAAVLGYGQSALAHTVIRDKATEGQTLYTAAVITHGCAAGESTDRLPVRAQSILFPNNTDSILTRLDTNQPTSLGEVIEGAAPVLAISPTMGQDKNVFKRQKKIQDLNVLVGAHSVPNGRAFQYWKGRLRTDAQGYIPFGVSGINFKSSSCAKSLLVRIAIANWCTNSQSTDDDNRVDVWIGRATPLFNDTGVLSLGFWPTLTINRDLSANPLPAGCNGGYDVAIEPSDNDIDNILPIQGYWPKP